MTDTNMTDTNMTGVTMSTTDTLNDYQALPETPGLHLQRAREKAQLSLEAVATELNLSVSKLQALENDQYEKIACDTFVKGYMRSYARVLKLDADEFLRNYEEYRDALRDTAERVTHAAGQLAQKETLSLDNTRAGWLLPAAIVVALLVVWALTTTLLGGDNKAGEVAAAKPDPARTPAEFASAPVPASVVEGAVEQELDAANSAVGDTAPGDYATPVVEDAVDSVAATADPAPAPSSALDTLTFSFKGECWVEVSDAKGDVLFTDLQQPGEALSLQGQAPFKIMLGNAKAVTLHFNGDLVSTQTSESRKTLRITVGQ